MGLTKTVDGEYRAILKVKRSWKSHKCCLYLNSLLFVLIGLGHFLLGLWLLCLLFELQQLFHFFYLFHPDLSIFQSLLVLQLSFLLLLTHFPMLLPPLLGTDVAVQVAVPIVCIKFDSSMYFLLFLRSVGFALSSIKFSHNKYITF